MDPTLPTALWLAGQLLAGRTDRLAQAATPVPSTASATLFHHPPTTHQPRVEGKSTLSCTHERGTRPHRGSDTHGAHSYRSLVPSTFQALQSSGLLLKPTLPGTRITSYESAPATGQGLLNLTPMVCYQTPSSTRTLHPQNSSAGSGTSRGRDIKHVLPTW